MPGDAVTSHRTVVDHYTGADEAGRLQHGTGKLEYARTMEIIDRYAPPPPAVVLDVGGGAGIYALPLAQKGYEVHLIDPVPKHCDQARKASESTSQPLASISLGDARTLDWSDGSVDCVLLLGPLYHLTEKADRVRGAQRSCAGAALRRCRLHRSHFAFCQRHGWDVQRIYEGSRFPEHRCPGFGIGSAPQPHRASGLLHDSVLPPST